MVNNFFSLLKKQYVRVLGQHLSCYRMKRDNSYNFQLISNLRIIEWPLLFNYLVGITYKFMSIIFFNFYICLLSNCTCGVNKSR